MQRMRLGLAGLMVAALTATMAVADPKADKPGKGHGAGGPPAHRHVDGGGPPPWAPAHGYRSKQETGYALPLDLADGRCNRDVIGELLGGAAGSQAGDGRDRIIAIIEGALGGVLLGGEVGGMMARADQLCFDQALEQAPDGRAIAWRDADAGRDYVVTPNKTYQNQAGRYCRDYTARATTRGKPGQSAGTVCRLGDGSWETVN